MKIRNLTPAITNIDKAVLRIGSEPLEYYRTWKFNGLLHFCDMLLQRILGIDGYNVSFLTASGTGAMDAVICNYVEKTDKILILDRGTFGKRWSDICSFYDITHTIAYSIGKVKEAITNNEVNILLMQGTETSTGEKLLTDEIKALCKQHSVKLIVDAMSYLFVDSLDASDIDICIVSSQKGLSLFPGLSIVLSKAGIEAKPKSYYLDLTKYMNTYQDLCLPFTPAVVVLKQLCYRLGQINKEKLAYIDRYALQAIHFRKLMEDLPVEMPIESKSNCATLVRVPSKQGKIKTFFEALQKKRIYITPTGATTGDTLLVGHIGDLTQEDNLALFKEMDKWLKE
jgi:aspartate aminotransferase-like enzyme